ncbi:uncharacterized protein LOC110743693 [Papio anubis]|uniref:uncharacterized protein LOC110743693 n=1 Tax=Papio anubis TaxID=9555 RepID=UPI0012AD4CF7|nr:uncharacterized protein LOC110743693 [Papio anubis]
MHETTHLGQESLEKLLGRFFYVSHLPALDKAVAQWCVTCRQYNARQGPTVPPGIQAYGAAPFEDLQVDFTEMPKCGGDRVWIKDWNVAPLRPQWKGPQIVILTTPTAVKLEGIPAWIHHSRVKPAADETREAKPSPDNTCKVTLRRMTSPAPVTPGS